MEKLSTTTPEKMTDHQSSKTGSQTSPSIDLEYLKKKQDDIRKKRGFKPRPEKKDEPFVPEFATCEIHGEYQCTHQGIAFPGRPMRVYRKDSCPECEKIKQAKIDEYQKAQELKSALSMSGVPKRHAGKTMESVDLSEPGAKTTCVTISGYMSNFEKVLERGSSGFFCGECGTGKTMFACMIVENAIRSGFSARYITAWNMIQEIRLGYSATDISIVSQINSFIRHDILVIDEIGVQHGTDDERVLLYQVIDGRYNEVKPTILISNSRNPTEDGYLDARTIDRLKEGGGFSITFNGKSYRK